MDKNNNSSKFEKKLVKDLIFADWNYKKDEPDKLEKLKSNLQRNGQVETIIIRDLKNGKFEVVNGNHRLKAFQDLGWETVQVCNLGVISLSQAKRIAVETNETRFDSDQEALGKLLEEISIDFSVEDLELTMPFSETEMQQLMDIKNIDLPEIDLDLDDSNLKQRQFKTQLVTCPHCEGKFNIEV